MKAEFKLVSSIEQVNLFADEDWLVHSFQATIQGVLFLMFRPKGGVHPIQVHLNLVDCDVSMSNGELHQGVEVCDHTQGIPPDHTSN